MAFSITNSEKMGYSAETTWGTTVAANPITLLRYVSGSMKTDTTSTMSAEIGTSREVSDHIRTQARGNGQINLEWSYGSFDDILEALLGGTWTTNVLKVGTVKRSFTFERQFTDITQFEAYKGAIITGVTLNAGIGKVIDGSFSFMSKAGVSAGATVGTGTTAVNTNPIFNPIDHIQLVREGGVGSIPGVTEFTVNLRQNGIDFGQIASIDPANIQAGRFEADGTISVYKQDATYLAKYLDWTTTSLQFDIGGAANLKYSLLFSKVKLSQAETPNGGINQPLVEKFNWTAFLDATDTTLKITRTP